MELYENLSVAAQVAYSDLYAATQQYEANRDSTHLHGSILYKTIKGKKYAYFSYRSHLDGAIHQWYLGPDSEAVRRIRLDRNGPAKESIQRSSRAAMAQGNVSFSSKHYQILSELGNAGMFRNGAVLVGSHAYNLFGNMLGLRWRDATQTLDIDFGFLPSKLAVAMPGAFDTDVPAAINRLKMGFIPSLTMAGKSNGRYVSESEPGFSIDFLTPMSRDGNPVVHKSMRVAMSPLQFFDFLIEEPTQGVAMARAGAVVVNIPRPERYALHKLLISGERPSTLAAKSKKDIVQSAALIDYLLDHEPTSLQQVWDDLNKRGAGWRKRLDKGMSRLNVLYPTIGQRWKSFLEPYGSESRPSP